MKVKREPSELFGEWFACLSHPLVGRAASSLGGECRKMAMMRAKVDSLLRGEVTKEVLHQLVALLGSRPGTHGSTENNVAAGDVHYLLNTMLNVTATESEALGVFEGLRRQTAGREVRFF